MGKRKSKGIEISHWKVGETDDFQGIIHKEDDEAESVMPEDDEPDQRKEDERPTRNRRRPHLRKGG